MVNRIRLDAMHERHRALTSAIAGAYEEAASVCLSRNHASPVEITLSDNGSEAAAEVAWIEPDSRIRDAWANATDATENGAYGCVIAGSSYCVIFLRYGGLRPALVQIITWGQLAREERILRIAFALKCPASGAEIAVT